MIPYHYQITLTKNYAIRPGDHPMFFVEQGIVHCSDLDTAYALIIESLKCRYPVAGGYSGHEQLVVFSAQVEAVA